MDTTKTADPTAPEADTAEPQAAEAAEAKADLKDAPAAETAEATEPALSDEELEDALHDDLDDTEKVSDGVGAAASAVVAAGLGLVALSGSWVSRVIAERQTLVGQIESVNAATTEAKIEALYGDAWHMTALVNGVLSTLALLLAVFVLARPAFGAPGRTLPTWVRAVSWAAVALGALGVLLFGLMYFDILAPLPKAA
ncbi:hypothetical protein ACIA98_05390 [Streptomyces sp. NPDC051366]|uniref:hypothetical protein n=1 Tax=unclassified Streptomyces TaxID=2593676 RepID=UPI00225BBD4B|nr:MULTISPECIES: hypothetical protein [unclassified Streptomyces]MCX4627392.1 hypothetical protein [Streptomyces sp. NBC_01443]WSW43538.1 hypothetical protein OG296_10640 [Streptomyces sp. NBC_01001]